MQALFRHRFHRALEQRQQLVGEYLTGELAGTPYINVPVALGYIWRRPTSIMKKMRDKSSFGVFFQACHPMFISMGVMGSLLMTVGTFIPLGDVSLGLPMESFMSQAVHVSVKLGLLGAITGGIGLVLSKMDW